MAASWDLGPPPCGVLSDHNLPHTPDDPKGLADARRSFATARYLCAKQKECVSVPERYGFCVAETFYLCRRDIVFVWHTDERWWAVAVRRNSNPNGVHPSHPHTELLTRAAWDDDY